MPARTKVYLAVVMGAGLILALCPLPPAWMALPWPAAAVLVAACVTALRMRSVPDDGRVNRVKHTMLPAARYATVLLLPWRSAVAVLVLAYVVEHLIFATVLRRPPTLWYKRVFNTANTILGTAAAGLAFRYVLALASTHVSPGLALLAAAVAGAAASICVDQPILATVLVLTGGFTYRETGVLTRRSLLRLALLTLGAFPVVLLWRLDPWLILPALAPLVLVGDAMRVPYLEASARTDRRTGLANAGTYDDKLPEYVAAATADGRSFALLLLDLDHFKRINDQYGHPAGDAVLTDVGALVRGSLRRRDFAARIGGEEFAVLLADVDEERARAAAERLRAAVAAHPFAVPGPVTVSVGYALFPGHAIDAKTLHESADAALYSAKHNGRNRVSAGGSALTLA